MRQQLFKRRINNFINKKRSFYSLCLLTIILTISLFSEFVANDRPIVMSINGNIYFPVIKDYSEKEIGGIFPTSPDYKGQFMTKLIAEKGWAIWPIIRFSYKTLPHSLSDIPPSSPDNEHWLGTDQHGRDILATIIYALRLSILFGILLALTGTAIGVSLGIIQGYFGGLVDLFMQRVLEVWSSMPRFFILIIFAGIFAPSLTSIFLIMLLFFWIPSVGYARAEALRIRNFQYILAAKAMGLSDFRIIIRHVLPNTLLGAFSALPFRISASIATLSTLDFLGIGLSTEHASLGNLVQIGISNVQCPWIGISAFITMSILLTLFVFIGEGLKEIFDNKNNKL